MAEKIYQATLLHHLWSLGKKEGEKDVKNSSWPSIHFMRDKHKEALTSSDIIYFMINREAPDGGAGEELFQPREEPIKVNIAMLSFSPREIASLYDRKWERLELRVQREMQLVDREGNSLTTDFYKKQLEDQLKKISSQRSAIETTTLAVKQSEQTNKTCGGNYRCILIQDEAKVLFNQLDELGVSIEEVEDGKVALVMSLKDGLGGDIGGVFLPFCNEEDYNFSKILSDKGKKCKELPEDIVELIKEIPKVCDFYNKDGKYYHIYNFIPMYTDVLNLRNGADYLDKKKRGILKKCKIKKPYKYYMRDIIPYFFGIEPEQLQPSESLKFNMKEERKRKYGLWEQWLTEYQTKMRKYEGQRLFQWLVKSSYMDLFHVYMNLCTLVTGDDWYYAGPPMEWLRSVFQ